MYCSGLKKPPALNNDNNKMANFYYWGRGHFCWQQCEQLIADDYRDNLQSLSEKQS